MIFIGMLFAAPIYVVSAGINAILVTMYARRRGQRAAGPWQSRAGLLFYALTLFYPFTVTDFGDTGPALPSRLTAWFGVSEDISAMIAYGLWWVLAVLAILMIVGGAVDMSLLKRDIEPQWVARGYGMGSQHYPLSQPGYGEFRPANQQPGYPYPPAPGQNGPHYSGEDGGYNYPDQSGYYPDQGGYYPNRSGDPSLDQGGYPGPDQSGPRY